MIYISKHWANNLLVKAIGYVSEAILDHSSEDGFDQTYYFF